MISLGPHPKGSAGQASAVREGVVVGGFVPTKHREQLGKGEERDAGLSLSARKGSMDFMEARPEGLNTLEIVTPRHV